MLKLARMTELALILGLLMQSSAAERLNKKSITGLSLIGACPSNGPEYFVETQANGVVQTFSESYFIAGEWDGTPGIACMEQTVTIPVQGLTRTLDVYETTLSESITTLLRFIDPSAGAELGSKTGPASSPSPSSFVSDIPMTTIVRTNQAGAPVTEVFVHTTYTEFLNVAALTTVSITTAGSDIPLAIGPSGIGWNIPLQLGMPIAPPLNLPELSYAGPGQPQPTEGTSQQVDPAVSHGISSSMNSMVNSAVSLGISSSMSNAVSSLVSPVTGSSIGSILSPVVSTGISSSIGNTVSPVVSPGISSSMGNIASSIINTVVSTTDYLGQPTSNIFIQTTYPDFGTLASPTTIITTIQGYPIPIVIGALGLGWAIPIVSDRPVAPPLFAPPNAINSPSSQGSPISTSQSTTSTQQSPAITPFLIFPTDPVEALTTGETTYSTGGHRGGIPILAPHCWFCPPGPPNLLGWLLTGFRLPGIYPPGPPPVGFLDPFPPITIGPDGDPTFSSKPPESEKESTTNSESTSKCSTQTATSCDFSISVWVPDGSSVTSTSTFASTCIPVTSCNVQGATSMTTITGSELTAATNGYWPYQSEAPASHDELEAIAKQILADIASNIAEEETAATAGPTFMNAPTTAPATTSAAGLSST